MVLLKDALMPNLVQTVEGVPALRARRPVRQHRPRLQLGLATKMALAHADWVVTEAGFGFDLGAEKFFDIKCLSAGLDTAAVVLVATVRALKLHGGVDEGRSSPSPTRRRSSGARQPREARREHPHLRRAAGRGAQPLRGRLRGGDRGGAPAAASALGGAVRRVRGLRPGRRRRHRAGRGGHRARRADGRSRFCPLYELAEPVKVKMAKIARAMYGARDVAWTQGGGARPGR